MHTNELALTLLTASIAAGICTPCFAQNPAPAGAPTPATSAKESPASESEPFVLEEPREAASKSWRFDLTAWIWLAGIEGTVGARGVTADVDESFIDILDSTDSVIGLAGRLEIGKGKLAGFVDGMYMKLGVDDATGPDGMANVDVVQEMGLVDFGVMYRLLERPASDASARMMTIDAYAGARYQMLSLELEPANAAPRKREKDWIDPIIGVKFVAPFAKHWSGEIWGDIGGFGAASDFTWSCTAVLGYDFEIGKSTATIFAGYRALGTDYSNGSGSDEFVWDVVLHGPIIGFSLAF